MDALPLSGQFDVILRRQSLERVGVSVVHLNEITERDPASENPDLLVYGPSFGVEAADEAIRRLNGIGLEYWDDVLVVDIPLPDWLGIKAVQVSAST